MLLPLLPIAAQEKAPAPAAQAAPLVVLSLQQSSDEAMTNGYDNRLLKDNLLLARFQHAENVSHNSWGLGGSAGLGYNLPGGDNGVLAAKQGSLNTLSGSTQGAQLGIGVNAPLTSVSVTASPWAPPVLPAGSTL